MGKGILKFFGNKLPQSRDQEESLERPPLEGCDDQVPWPHATTPGMAGRGSLSQASCATAGQCALVRPNPSNVATHQVSAAAHRIPLQSAVACTPSPAASMGSGLEASTMHAPAKRSRAHSEGDAAQRAAVLKRKLESESSSVQQLKEVEERFTWLKAPPTDVNGCKPGDAAYDGRTIRIPPAVFKEMSASQKQYWGIKVKYMDVVLFFKVGKFYELYEDDAQLAHSLLDWKITCKGVGKCRQAGCPESGLQSACSALAAAGHKFGVIEQLLSTAQSNTPKKPKTAIVQRRLMAIETPATTFEPSQDGAVHLLALHLSQSTEKHCGTVGFAVLDAASAMVQLGTVTDDANLGALRTLLAHTAPTEILLAQNSLPSPLLRCLKDPALGAEVTSVPVHTVPAPAAAAGVLSTKPAFAAVKQAVDTLPDRHRPAEALAALVGMLDHLQRMQLLDALSTCVQVKPFAVATQHMRIDGASMANLELVHGPDGSAHGSLLAVLDHCRSAGGRRQLRAWLCRPLFSVDAIVERQRAVAALQAEPELLDELYATMQRHPDLPRALGRLRTLLAPPSEVLPTPIRRAAQQKRLSALYSAVSALCSYISALHGACEAFAASAARTPLLASLLSSTPDAASDSSKLLHMLSGLFIREAPTAKAGKKKGNAAIVKLDATQCEELAVEGEEEQLGAESAVVTELLEAVLEHDDVWQALANAVSTLDVLASFASFAASADGATCMPSFVAAGAAAAAPAFHAVGMWHPALAQALGTEPVPIDLQLGQGASGATARAAALLLTGPNMGGKSTVLRTACVLAVIAQLGCPVPASSLSLTPVDAVFTRLGATDRILHGDSTFMVECEECAAVLRDATRSSLVILDELGRGTSTFDGYAIAFAVLHQLTSRRGCRLLFATHYHALNVEFAQCPEVQLGHMAASFHKPSATAPERIVFQYKLAAGACPASYGLHVAALAGIPAWVCEIARKMGGAFEAHIAQRFACASSGQPAVETARPVDAAIAAPAGHTHASGARPATLAAPRCRWDAATALLLLQTVMCTPERAAQHATLAAPHTSLPDVQSKIRKLLPAPA